MIILRELRVHKLKINIRVNFNQKLKFIKNSVELNLIIAILIFAIIHLTTIEIESELNE